MCFRPPAASGSKVCDVCGAENPGIAINCKECGAELQENNGPTDGISAPSAPGVPDAPGAPKAPGVPKVPKKQ